MRPLAAKASLPGMLNEVDSASLAGLIAAKPPIASATQRPRTSFLWARTQRVREVMSRSPWCWSDAAHPGGHCIVDAAGRAHHRAGGHSCSAFELGYM